MSSSLESCMTIADLKGWSGDGAVILATDPAEYEDAQKLKIPVVTLGGSLEKAGLPRVMSDQYAIGRLGATFLLACGFRNLAYYGLQTPWYSLRRRQGFVDRAREADIECVLMEEVVPTRAISSWQKRIKPLKRWLRSLKKPAGIMAVHDYRAQVLLEECYSLNLNVPHQVAVLGVDNNAIVCENCQPTLSSVSRNPWRIGYEAAKMLDQLMSGTKPVSTEILIPPDSVVSRRSTDTIAVDNPHVSAAARYMHDNLRKNLTIETILKEVGISRRLLEKLFHSYLGCSPHHYLCRLRVEKAKDLLATNPRKKIQSIIKECGFSSPDRMRLMFRSVTGMTPTQFREKNARENVENQNHNNL
ncbi:MAG: DNA-binding transcriptional regulator [Pirellulales bacterium]|nr:DNA-binding transcriptional regulator [Pirellulales bacterium]